MHVKDIPGQSPAAILAGRLLRADNHLDAARELVVEITRLGACADEGPEQLWAVLRLARDQAEIALTRIDIARALLQPPNIEAPQGTRVLWSEGGKGK